MVQKRQSYDKLIALGADKGMTHHLGHIYEFAKENGHRPEALICTNSDRLEMSLFAPAASWLDTKNGVDRELKKIRLSRNPARSRKYTMNSVFVWKIRTSAPSLQPGSGAGLLGDQRHQLQRIHT